MDNKEEFKSFAKKHPELIDYVSKKEKSWQEFYELWNIYGEDENVWNKYKSIENTQNNVTGINDIFNMIKKVKPETIQSSITNVQKFLTYVSTFVEDKKVPKISKFDRPVNKVFED